MADAPPDFQQYVKTSVIEGLKIERDVSLGAACTVNQGLGEIPRYIGLDTKIDCGVHIAHYSANGSRNVIAGNADFRGSVTTGKDVFVGINATIVNGITLADGCFVGAGAIVTWSYKSAVKLIALRAKPQKYDVEDSEIFIKCLCII